MKEFDYEDNIKVDKSKLIRPLVPFNEYSKIHLETIRACHDVFIAYQGGILLVHRIQKPLINSPWPIGGGIRRGVSFEDSLKKLTFDECGLKLENITELAVARTFFQTDPFDHGFGTDTLNVVCFARATPDSKLSLNEFHKNPLILKKQDFTPEFRSLLHPYVDEFLAKAFEYL